MNTHNVNVKTATKESSERWVMASSEPLAAKVLAFHGQDASYAYNVLADLKANGDRDANLVVVMDRQIDLDPPSPDSFCILS